MLPKHIRALYLATRELCIRKTVDLWPLTFDREANDLRPKSMVSATDIPKSQRFAIALPSTWVAAGIVVAYVLLALWWGVVVPIGEGPDEPGHFNYALFVARVGRLPVQSEGAGEVPGEGHQPPLAYWLMQPALLWLPPAEQTLEMGPNPQFWPAGDDANAYLRSSRDIWPYSGIGRAWHLARAISALLCGATVALTYAVARRCLPRQPGIALGAAALVAFNPQFVFAGALVSNDALLFALSAALLLLCLMIVEAAGAPPRYRLALAAGAGLLLGPAAGHQAERRRAGAATIFGACARLVARSRGPHPGPLSRR